MSVQLHLSHDDKEITFHNKSLGLIGFTDYTPRIWKQLSKVNWYVDGEKYLIGDKTYIYTGSKRFKNINKLHQIVMMLWYGEEALQASYEKKFIIEHHNNNAFDCHINNLSFASNDLNLTKAHSFDKTQPKLLQQVAVNFYKDFETQQYQITIKFNEDYQLTVDENKVIVDRLYLLYKDNFRVVYTDANRIVDELLENGGIDFKLLTYIDFTYKEATFYVAKDGEQINGIQIATTENGRHLLLVGKDMKEKIFFKSIPPDQELYKNKN